jgi:hypothetical protein
MSATDLIDKVETARLIGGEGKPVSIGFVNQLLAARILPKVRLSYKVCRIPRSRRRVHQEPHRQCPRDHNSSMARTPSRGGHQMIRLLNIKADRKRELQELDAALARLERENADEAGAPKTVTDKSGEID